MVGAFDDPAFEADAEVVVVVVAVVVGAVVVADAALVVTSFAAEAMVVCRGTKKQCTKSGGCCRE